jgi:hypothetical protein
MKHGFNQAIQECQSTADLMTDTLTMTFKIDSRKMEDALAIVTQKLKDQDDTITLLK